MTREELLTKLAFARFKDWKEGAEITEHVEDAIIHTTCLVISNPTLGVYTDIPDNVYKKIYDVLIELKIINPVILPEGFDLFTLLVTRP